jgi:hypothetical protein
MVRASWRNARKKMAVNDLQRPDRKLYKKKRALLPAAGVVLIGAVASAGGGGSNAAPETANAAAALPKVSSAAPQPVVSRSPVMVPSSIPSATATTTPTPTPAPTTPAPTTAAPPSQPAAPTTRPAAKTTTKAAVAPTTKMTAPPNEPPAGAALPRYSNCDSLHATYPHGVGMPGAVDSVRDASDPPVTTFTKDAALYAAQPKTLDRDHDNIACEQA